MADTRQGDLYSVEDDGTETDVWIMEELLADDDLDEGEYSHVIGGDDADADTPPITNLYGTEKSGHWGHAGVKGKGPGGSAPKGDGDAPVVAAMREGLEEARGYGDTKFILPDGTRLRHDYDTHADAVQSLGEGTLHTALKAGVLRYVSGFGADVASPITDAQAQHLIDGARADPGHLLYVDVFVPDPDQPSRVRRGTTAGQSASRQFDPERDTADTVRHWVNGHFAHALSHREQLRWVLLYGLDADNGIIKDSHRVDLIGTASSGNRGHAGRPGHRGGSAPREGGPTAQRRAREASTEAGTSRPRSRPELTFEPHGTGQRATKKDGRPLVVVGEVPPAAATTVLGPGHDLVKIVGQMVGDVPGDLSVELEARISGWGGGPSVRMEVNRDDGLSITRVLKREAEGLVVDHHYFVVPRDKQGQGLAKTVLANGMRVYRKLGVKKVVVSANIDAGGYAWARFGFKADFPNTLANQLQRRMPEKTRELNLTTRQSRALVKLIEKHKDDPRLPWQIAKVRVGRPPKPIGKQLLKNVGWAGTLDLADEEQMKRFDHYVKGH